MLPYGLGLTLHLRFRGVECSLEVVVHDDSAATLLATTLLRTSERTRRKYAKHWLHILHAVCIAYQLLRSRC